MFTLEDRCQLLRRAADLRERRNLKDLAVELRASVEILLEKKVVDTDGTASASVGQSTGADEERAGR